MIQMMSRCRQTILNLEKDNPSVAKILSPMTDENLISIYLLRQLALGNESSWAPYINSLPAYVPVLYTWSEQALQSLLLGSSTKSFGLLQNTTGKGSLYDAANQLKSILQKSYGKHADAIEVIVPHGAFSVLTDSDPAKSDPWVHSFSAWVWAHSVVDSRALSIKGSRYLVPFADMHNYEPQEEKRRHNSGESFLKYHKLTSSG